MDLKDIDWKAGLQQIAPVIGGMVSGPAGLLFTAGLSAVSAAIFGHPNASESEISAAIEKGLPPEAIVALQGQEHNFRVQMRQLNTAAEANRLAAETQQIQAVNQTMQVETKSEHWAQWSWRPFNGFILGLGTIEALSALSYLAYRGIVMKDPAALGMIPALAAAFIGILGVPGAAVGIASWHRGVLKRRQAGEAAKG